MIIAICLIGWIAIAGSPFRTAEDWIAMIVVVFVILALVQQNPIKSISENFQEQNAGNDGSPLSNYINVLDKITSSYMMNGTSRTKTQRDVTSSTLTATNMFGKSGGGDDDDDVTNNNSMSTSEILKSLPSGVSDSLSLFVSSSSVPKNRIWTNLVSRTTQKQYCMDGSLRGSELVFNREPANEEPAYRPPAYFLGKGTSIEGPPSHMMGLDGNRNMTIFFVARMLLPSSGSVKAFQISANTSNNNGISMMFLPAPHVVGVQIGAMPMIEGIPPSGKGLGAPKDSLSHNWFVDESHMHLWVLSKTQTNLTVTSFDLETRTVPKARPYINRSISMDGPLILSNLPFQINGDLSWEARLMEFGVLPKALEQSEMQNMAQTFKDKIESNDPTIMEYKQKIDELGSKVKSLTACPYNETVCATCGNSVHGDIAASTPECMRAVAAFCDSNPSHPRCVCWNSNTPQCHAYKQLLRQGGQPQECKQVPCKPAPAPAPAAPAPVVQPPPPTKSACPEPEHEHEHEHVCRKKSHSHSHSHKHSHKKKKCKKSKH